MAQAMYSALPTWDWDRCTAASMPSGPAGLDRSSSVEREKLSGTALLSHGHEPEPVPFSGLSGLETNLSERELTRDRGSRSGKRRLTWYVRGKLGLLGIREAHHSWQILMTCADMMQTHLMELACLSLSFCLCWLVGAVELELVDPSFFRATGLLLAVMLSLRAKNALTRRQVLMNTVLKLMNSARNIVGIVGHITKARKKRLFSFLCFCFHEIALHVDEVSPMDHHAWGLEDLDPEDREAAFILRSKLRLQVSPRPLLIHVRQVVDELVDLELHFRLANSKSYRSVLRDSHKAGVGIPEASVLGPEDPSFVDRVSIIRRYHRLIDVELYHVVHEFDALLMFRERLLTPQFRYMIHAIIFIYVTLYPWCVQNESAAILGLTSIGMGFVFYGLNHMTNGLEDPMKLKGQGFNLALTFQNMFVNLEREDSIHAQAEEFLRARWQDGSEVVITDAVHDEFVEAQCRKRSDRERRMDSRDQSAAREDKEIASVADSASNRP
mmetsp:Transcript_19235/g.50800  ORF Transcript_19235/g.50800 Transcript_19235/m.50800 type:complete len:497 (-) Transcript_19235:28-1518(-)